MDLMLKMDSINTATQNIVPKNVSSKWWTDVTVPNVLVIAVMIAITTLAEVMILLNKNAWVMVKEALILSVLHIQIEITVWLIWTKVVELSITWMINVMTALTPIDKQILDWRVIVAVQEWMGFIHSVIQNMTTENVSLKWTKHAMLSSNKVTLVITVIPTTVLPTKPSSKCAQVQVKMD